MDITRTEVVSLFKSLGLKGAAALNTKRLEAKINKLLDIVDDDTVIDDDDQQTLLTSVCEALKKKETVKVTKEKDQEDSPAAEPEPATEEEPTIEEEPEETSKKRKRPQTRKTKGRGYCAGKVIKKYGIESPITDEMVREVDEMFGKANYNESEFWLLKARQFLAGYNEEWD